MQSPIREGLEEVLKSGQPITVGVVGMVRTTFSASSFASVGLNIDEWRQIKSQETAGHAERELLMIGAAHKNLRVLDRRAMMFAFGEAGLANIGLFDNPQKADWGDAKGATHLIVYEVNRAPRRDGGIEDRVEFRLIEVKTGTVLAIESHTN
jgi:hypothetical protein